LQDATTLPLWMSNIPNNESLSEKLFERAC